MIQRHLRLLQKVVCVSINRGSSLAVRSVHSTSAMSNSKYEYVRGYEADDRLLPNTWIVVRVDGKQFHVFSEKHGFSKPNDKRALDLMNACARKVMEDFRELLLAYGQSDEYSFVFRKNTQLYSRRSFKLATNIASLFAAAYVMKWGEFFPETPLQYPPAFDARTVLYPTNRNLRDYLSWRQVDCHINNLYNTTFWALVLKGGRDNKAAEAEIRSRAANSSRKNEVLFSEFGINYNNEAEQFKKGTTIYRERAEEKDPTPAEEGEGEPADKGKGDRSPKKKNKKLKTAKALVEETCDIIGDPFWERNPHLIAPFEDS